MNDAYGTGCSSSIAAALGALDPRCDVLVLLLGDQPGVTAGAVAALLAGRGERRSPSAATTTAAGTRSRSGARCSASSRRCTATRPCGSCSTGGRTTWPRCRFPGRVPRDVDTWADYEAVVAAAGA